MADSPPLKYPWHVLYIIANEFCERYNYYAMTAILPLYITTELNYSESMASVFFHAFKFVCYFTCIIGAFISDSWLGKFRTILYLSGVYLAGELLVLGSSFPQALGSARAFLFLGLFVVGSGAGGIKPCVAAFSGDQFQLPEQMKHMLTFFSMFYFTINLGSFLGSLCTPILRAKVHCFGSDQCFPLAFGVPSVLMFLAVLVFFLGRRRYSQKLPEGNVFMLVTKCIGTAISQRCKRAAGEQRRHWMDYAVPQHSQQLVNDIKVVISIIVLFIPVPLFWALFDQQGSRWMFQATRMDGRCGDAFTILPDQINAANPLFVMVLIPFINFAVYPLMNRCRIGRPLQRMVVGGITAAVAFLCAGVLQIYIEKASAKKKVHLLWQLPQIVIISFGEVMISVTGLAFAYEQAPVSMKSVVSACWNLTIAFGNVLDVILMPLIKFKNESNEFFLFGGLLVLDMLLFVWLAHRYVYTENGVRKED